jgi:hypothetical protein
MLTTPLSEPTTWSRALLQSPLSRTCGGLNPNSGPTPGRIR